MTNDEWAERMASFFYDYIPRALGRLSGKRDNEGMLN
jgi:hypothetical protein